MNKNYIVLIALWIVAILLLSIFVPGKRLREAIAAFLFFQMMTWLFSIGLTFAGLLESPVRFFKYATKISFTNEYAVFPTMAVFFQITFPQNAKFLRRLIHYLLWVGNILLIMFLLGSFTTIMTVKTDNLIRSFFNFTIELWLCRQYVLWVTSHPNETEVTPS